jgi:hypothetical protein
MLFSIRNVLMMQVRRGLGLVLEAPQLLGIQRGGKRQHFQSNAPAKRDLFRFVHDAHAHR